MNKKLIEKYYREDKLPHIWCAGCTNGIVTNAIVKAIDSLGYNQDKICIVSGIGCSSRATGYLDFNTLHTTHGRALAFATGIKMANPELKVLIITGDGDCTAIGGNHFIHACRRNIDITTILFNNNIYGMTGGQYSPTTPTMSKGTTTPYGNIDSTFDICNMAIATGATYVARGTAYHVTMLIDMIKKAMGHKGFSLVEVLSDCPTYFGRKNNKGTNVDMMKFLRDNSVNIKGLNQKNREKIRDKFIIGELRHIEKLEYTEEYQKIIDQYKEK